MYARLCNEGRFNVGRYMLDETQAWFFFLLFDVFFILFCFLAVFANIMIGHDQTYLSLLKLQGTAGITFKIDKTFLCAWIYTVPQHFDYFFQSILKNCQYISTWDPGSHLTMADLSGKRYFNIMGLGEKKPGCGQMIHKL